MSLSTDFSLIEFFLDKNEPLLNGSDKDLTKNDQKMPNLSDQWNGSSEEIFDSIKFDFDDPNFLPLFEGLTNERTPESNCSDSGMSSDHQMSPHVIQDEDEDSTVATIAPFQQDEMQIIYTDQDIQSNEEIELDSTDVSFIETNTLDEETFEETEMDDSIVEVPREENKKFKKSKTIKPQVFKVTPVLGNPRSVLLPISLKDLQEMKTIKIIKQPSSYSSSERNSGRRFRGESTSHSSDEGEQHYPRLELTPEEKKLLQKEGVRLPDFYPLTKQEERELKRIRRKIRNKISAQDSRKRKKEYIDGLENRVKKCTEENMHLVKRIKQLEGQKEVLQSQKESLVTQIRKLQAVVSRTGGKAVQPATCLMVLMLSMALVMMPSMRNGNTSNTEMSSAENEQILLSEKPMPIGGRSRSLLFKSIEDSDVLLDGDKTGRQTDKLIADLEHLLQFRPKFQEENLIDEDELFGPSSPKRSRHLIIPPLDDVWPPPPEPDGQMKITVNDFKLNFSDAGGTRTIVLPKDI